MKLHSQFSRKRFYTLSLQSLRQLCVKCEIPTSYFQNYPWCQVIRSYVKWGMASLRCYSNLDPGKMYPIWNFGLSLARHKRLIFCGIDNGVALVTQSWTGIATQKSDRTLS